MIRFMLDDKSPTEDQVYSIDWTKFLGLDTFDPNGSSPTADVLEGTALIDTLSYKDATTMNFRVRGGTLGDVVRGLIHVHTTNNQDLDAEIIFGVR